MSLSVEALKSVLEKEEVQSEIVEGIAEFPFNQLVVPFMELEDGEQISISITVVGATQLADKANENYQFLQFFVGFPYKIPEEKVADTVRLLNMINLLSQLPGFAMVESEPAPFYRYSMLCNGGKLDEQAFLGTFGLVVFTVDSFLGTIVDFIQGDISLDDAIKEIEEK